MGHSKHSGDSRRRVSSPPRGKPREVKAVLFDYGGTLFKATRPWSEGRAEGLASAYALLKRSGLEMDLHGFLELSESVFKKYSELEAKEDRDIADRVKHREIVDALFPDLSEERRGELALDATQAFWHTVTRSYPLRKSARRTLRGLATAGLRMGVVSNHHDYESLKAHLEEFGIHSHFEVVLASEREGVRKPNIVIFERSLAALRVEKEHAIFVGDSLKHDIVGARRAGLATVLIDDGEHPEGWATYTGATGPEARPDFVIRDLLEIRGIVDALNGLLGDCTAAGPRPRPATSRGCKNKSGDSPKSGRGRS